MPDNLFGFFTCFLKNSSFYNDALITLKFELSQKSEIIFINNELIMTLAAKNESLTKGSLKQYPFTKVGVHKIVQINDDDINHENKNMLYD